MAADVAVVGGGIVGATIARELARRGRRTVLVEQGSFGGAVTGASLACLGTHMNGRDEIEILKWSCAAWAELDRDLDHAIEYQRCGQIRYVAHDDDLPLARDWVDFERQAGLDTELLSPAALRRIEPLLEAPVVAATWSPGAATVTPFLAVKAILRDAVRHGLTVRSHSAVRDFIWRGDRVGGVVTDGGPFEAGAVVLAAGPWTARLAARAGLRLPILPRRAQCLATVGLPPVVRTVVGACKSAHGVSAGYTQIQQAPSGQVLFNTVLAGGVSAPGAEDSVPEVDPRFVCDSIETLVWLFPSLAGVDLLRSWVRYEAVTPDDLFIVGPSGVPGLHLAAGDGGVGFGRAPAIARVVADGLDERPPPFDAGVWSPQRVALRPAA
jgi:D-hydroxyproline dehydrogenase subunit beta